jgi:hypothetical protein
MSGVSHNACYSRREQRGRTRNMDGPLVSSTLSVRSESGLSRLRLRSHVDVVRTFGSRSRLLREGSLSRLRAFGEGTLQMAPRAAVALMADMARRLATLVVPRKAARRSRAARARAARARAVRARAANRARALEATKTQRVASARAALLTPVVHPLFQMPGAAITAMTAPLAAPRQVA